MMQSMHKWLFSALALIALGLIALIIIAADRGALAPVLVGLYRFPMGDKVGHLLLFGLLACLVSLAAGRRARVWLALLAVGIVLEEVSQAWLPRRSFSLVDLGFSLLGVVLFGALGAHWAKNFNRKEREDAQISTKNSLN